MEGLNFDYERFAKEFIKQIPGNITGITLEAFADEYLAYVERNRASKTYEGVKLVCKQLLRYFSPARILDTIKLKDTEYFLESLKKNAPKGVYNYYRALKAMWNKGIQWNYLRENPFEKIKLAKRQNQKPVCVSEVIYEQILPHIEAEVVRDAVVTAFYTGCRLGELVNLTWQDVNLNEGLLTIGSSNFKTKTRKQRVVPVHPKVNEILLKRLPKIIKRDRHYVFSKANDSGFTGDYFSRRFKRACREAGVDEGLHFHCLRHGAITRMIINGAPLPAVQRIAGHANIQTTMIYTHPDIEDLRAAVNRL